MKIYIAGPMTGIKDWNFPAFFKAENELKELGYEVINPAHNDGETIEEALASAGSPERPNHSWASYMRRDLPNVLAVDALCVLPDWQRSKGARLEVQVAEALGLPIYVLRDGKLIPRVTVIGIAGWARSGKDTIADYLVNNNGYKKFSFSTPMKTAMEKLNPNIRILTTNQDLPLKDAVDYFGWEELKTISPDIRPLLQRFGTEVGREMFGDDFWVNYALDSIPDGTKAIIADVRYPNEANAIKALGGKVYRVLRDGVGPANDHPSEHALEGYEFDGQIDNNGTLDNLYYIVDEIVN